VSQRSSRSVTCPLPDGYRLLKRRPSTVEGVLVTEDNLDEVAEFIGGWTVPWAGVGMYTKPGQYNSAAYARPGEWVLHGPDGAWYPASQPVIDSQYEDIL
jgi:hypothetical protein